MIRLLYLTVLSFVLLMWNIDADAVGAGMDTDSESFSIEIKPSNPTGGDDVVAVINRARCRSLQDVFVESRPPTGIGQPNRIDVSITNGFGVPSDEQCTQNPNPILEVPLGTLDPGQYHLSYGLKGPGLIVSTVASNDFEVNPVQNTVTTAYHESPMQDSIQTGIGLIRGWACNAGKVEISIDGGQKERIPYGGSRGDTKDVCSNEGFNGYGTVMAWGLLSVGEHSLQTYVDDIEISDVTFTVVKVDDGFLKREGAEYTLTDFPETGQQVRVQWRDAIQNFTIISNPESVQ